MLKNSTISDCLLIKLPKIKNRSGNITAIENNTHIPFSVSRIFYLYDIPSGEDRGAHAHIKCKQFLVAASGSFEVLLDDGNDKKTVFLNHPFIGLYLPSGIWASLVNFSSGAISLAFASHKYEEDDYIRDYNKFINLKK